MGLRIKLLLIYDSVFLFNTKLINKSVQQVYREEIELKATKKKQIPVRVGP